MATKLKHSPIHPEEKIQKSSAKRASVMMPIYTSWTATDEAQFQRMKERREKHEEIKRRPIEALGGHFHDAYVISDNSVGKDFADFVIEHRKKIVAALIQFDPSLRSEVIDSEG